MTVHAACVLGSTLAALGAATALRLVARQCLARVRVRIPARRPPRAAE